MGRVYSVSFSAVAVTAAQDLFELLNPSDSKKPVTIREISVTQHSDAGDAQAESLQILLKRAAGSFTSGSGGSTATPAKLNSSDAAAVCTCEINNTTQASANTGSLTTIRAQAFNVQHGFQFKPDPAERPVLYPAEALLVCLTAPADSLTMNGTVVFEED